MVSELGTVSLFRYDDYATEGLRFNKCESVLTVQRVF
jgi:hypothetical protein